MGKRFLATIFRYFVNKVFFLKYKLWFKIGHLNLKSQFTKKDLFLFLFRCWWKVWKGYEQKKDKSKGWVRKKRNVQTMTDWWCQNGNRCYWVTRWNWCCETNWCCCPKRGEWNNSRYCSGRCYRWTCYRWTCSSYKTFMCNIRNCTVTYNGIGRIYWIGGCKTVYLFL